MLLSERSQSEEATCCMISTLWHSGKGKSAETVKRSVVLGFGRRDEEHIFRTVKWLYDTITMDTCHYTCHYTLSPCRKCHFCLVALKIFCFQQFDYTMSACSFLCIYLWSFLDLYIDVFCQIWKTGQHFFKDFSAPFSPSFWDTNICYIAFDIALEVTEALLLILLIFSFCSLDNSYWSVLKVHWPLPDSIYIRWIFFCMHCAFQF